jgi:hypothetical protein
MTHKRAVYARALIKHAKDNASTSAQQAASCALRCADDVQKRVSPFDLPVTTMDGVHIAIQVYQLMTVNHVKNLVAERLGVGLLAQRLYADSGELEKGDQTLDSYDVKNGSELHLVVTRK